AAAMIEIGENAEALRDDRVGRLVPYMRDESHPARVMLVAGVIKTLQGRRRRQIRLSPSSETSPPSVAMQQSVAPAARAQAPGASGQECGMDPISAGNFVRDVKITRARKSPAARGPAANPGGALSRREGRYR